MTYRIEQIGLDVIVVRQDLEEYSEYSISEITEAQAQEISQYIQDHELGYRTAYDRWRLKNKKAVMMFMLKYG